MNTKPIILIVFTMLLLSACGGKKEHHTTSSQLIEQVEQFSIDTIVTKPGDTLVNNTVDGVLRHYPELYRATQKAVKAYDKWVEISKVSGLKVKPETLNVNALLDETLFGENTQDADSAWQYLPVIDSLYIQALVNIPSGQSDTDTRKSAIGRTRRAWLTYAENLQALQSTLPEECRPRFRFIINKKTKQLTDENMYKQQ